MRVTVLSNDDRVSTRMAGYLVQLLDRLGYRADRKGLPYRIISRSLAFSGARASMQIYANEWFADYPSATAFIESSFRCKGSTNDGGFCDPRIDGEMRQAKALETTDPGAADARWSHIEHELVDASAWIPFATGKELDFVAKRVGNFQYHPEWGVLFDQLWVR
jgi:peptide/nickel transport system substrate-binding protein